MIRLVIILASIILSDSVSSASEFLICHCHNTNCFSNKTCQVPLSNGGCFVETSREKGSPLTFGCCINDHILSECKLYLRAYCQSGDYCNRDLQPVSITSGTEDSRNGPTLPPLTLPTESSNNATTNSTQPTDNGQSESTAENNNGTEQQGMLYLFLFLLCSIVLFIMIVFVSILIIIVKCKIKELESRKTTTNEAII